MSYSITNLSADLEGVLHGTTINQITNFYGLLFRAASEVLEDVDPQETKRIVQITGPVFNEVYYYAVPVDLKGNKIIDIRPQVNRQFRDVWLQQYNQDFDVSKQLSWQDSFTMQFNSGVKTVQINSPYLPQGVILNQASSESSNGTWSVGGGASNLSVDNQNYVVDAGSLELNLDAGHASGYVENSTMNAVDISEQLNQATEFLYTYLPSATAVTSVEFRWGSSATDYYARTVSVSQQNTAFQNGWNLLSYLWAGITPVGSPDPSSITYLRVTWNYDGTLQTGVRLNNIVSRMGQVLEMEYYSKYMFSDVAGAFKERVTANTDTVNLDTETYMLYFDKVVELAVQQQQGLNASFYDGPKFEQKYQNSLKRYKAMYKSELQKPTQMYYMISNPSYSRYIGRSINGTP